MAFGPPASTGWSSFWGTAPNAHQLLFGRSSAERRAAIALSRGGSRPLRAAMKALSGAAAGGAVSDTKAQVQAANGDNVGGARVVETVTLITGNTTAAQETYSEARVLDAVFAAEPSSYPVDASGNGGGGKIGF